MDNISHLHRLFAYDTWANREVLASLRKLEKPPSRSVQLLGHIISAQRLWFERIEARPQTLPVWPTLSLLQCEEEAADVSKRFENYLNGKDDGSLSKKVSYTNSKGESFTSDVQDILMHAIMHSVYHRGQIAADMRAAGFKPAYTDFIHSIRQGFVG
ncbi:MAG: DinB family protein [Acidobacteriaceae bacterium]|nr:DinB family protein [Acidobacteriaceae bacterium]